MLTDTLYLMQVYLLQQMGCQSRQKFHKNELKKTSKGSHWGDLRAAVELAVEKVCEAAKKDSVAVHGSESKSKSDSGRSAIRLAEGDDDGDEVDDVFSGNGEELVAAVRKILCPALRDLLQHGMTLPAAAKSGRLVPVGCFPTRSQQIPATSAQQRHAWDVILQYYQTKVSALFLHSFSKKTLGSVFGSGDQFLALGTSFWILGISFGLLGPAFGFWGSVFSHGIRFWLWGSVFGLLGPVFGSDH